MNDFCKNIIRDLDDEINELSIEFNDPLTLCEKAIGLTIDKIADLKQVILKRGFKDIDEEIHFFKHLKPNILSKLIYYNAIYKIETKKPYGGEKVIETHLNNELFNLKRFFDNNLEFYKYYRTNNTFIDDKLFIRGKYDIKLSLDTFYFEVDHRFSTSHDYKVAKIIAYDLIQVYLEDQLNNINHKKVSDSSSLNWTGSKTALIELIYALHSQGVFDDGNVDIRLIAKTFENIFNIDLGDFYHTFMELKSRKINRTKFLDNLRDAIICV